MVEIVVLIGLSNAIGLLQEMVDSRLTQDAPGGSSYGRSQTMPFQVFIAKYSYDPDQYSPNDNPDVELALTAGDYLFVYGDMDEV